MKRVRLLVVIDSTEASRRAVEYVARIVGGRRNFWVCLVQLLTPLPPGLLEFGGAERPEEEERLESLLDERRRRWVAAERRAARPVLDRARGLLRKAGLAAGRLSGLCLDPSDGMDAVEDILAQARAHRCRGVVVGRECMSRLRELVQGDLAEALVRRGKGYTVWVVE